LTFTMRDNITVFKIQHSIHKPQKTQYTQINISFSFSFSLPHSAQRVSETLFFQFGMLALG
ncbi:MAG: hypothetical protein K6253_03190, partial [Candidatus Liberibacter asiaticus]|nr:hypothetical protein [Candidatus Liberibacter asiaticus]